MQEGKKRDSNGRKVSGAVASLKCLELRRQGLGYGAIGTKVGLTAAGAYKAVQRELKRIEAETAETAIEVRRLELERLDTLWQRLEPKTKKGDTFAIGTALKIQARRSALLGLDAPERKEIKLSARPTELANELLAELEGDTVASD